MDNQFPKFRAWVKSETGGEWYMSYPRWIDFEGKRICTESGLQPGEFILMQSIRETDAFDVLVYEGDIIEPQYGKRSIIEWHDNGWMAHQPNANHYKPIPKCFWIVGNIYANKEMAV